MSEIIKKTILNTNKLISDERNKIEKKNGEQEYIQYCT
jgi:hypothetical protein